MTKNIFTKGITCAQFQWVKLLAAGLLVLLVFSSCTMKKGGATVETSRISQLEKKNTELTSRLAQQKSLSKKLQTKLLIQHKETDACRQANRKLVKEFFQSKAKSAGKGSKLEAATFIAESTAVISTVENQPLSEPQRIVLKRAIQKLKKGKQALAEGNFENAVYLARDAMAQAKGIDLYKDFNTGPLAEKEIFFSTPLQMELFITGNLRSGPSIKADIKKVLPKGCRVTAIGHKQNWVKVKVSNPEETGWIHLSLLY